MDLHAHAHLDAPLGHADAELLDHGRGPLRAHPARGQDHVAAGVLPAIGEHPAHPALVHHEVADLLGGVQGHAAFPDVLGQAADVPGQVLAAQVLLADEQQVDAVLLGGLADGPGGLHVRGIDRPIHAEAVEHGLGLLDQGHGRGLVQELGQVGLAEFVDEIELAVGEQPGPAHAAEDVAGPALDAALPASGDGALALVLGLALFQEQDRKTGVLGQPVGREQSGRAAAHDDHVEIGLLGLGHHGLLPGHDSSPPAPMRSCGLSCSSGLAPPPGAVQTTMSRRAPVIWSQVRTALTLAPKAAWLTIMSTISLPMSVLLPMTEVGTDSTWP